LKQQDAVIRMQELAQILGTYQHEYYILNNPSISDLEYDRLFDELLLLEQQFPDLTNPNSPTSRVGSDLSSSLPEKNHTIPVLSLNKAYSEEDLKSWVEKTEKNTGESLGYILEEKIDGLSVVLYYKKGQLESAVTRGNGYVGNDVTANIRTIKSIPLVLSKPLDLAVRGEVFLPLDKFEEINSTQEIPYANPRNLAAGTLRRVKSQDVSLIPLDIFIYEGFFDKTPDTHLESLALLKECGFKLNPHIGIFAENINTDLQNKFPEALSGAPHEFPLFINKRAEERKKLNYEIDGLIIKVNEMDHREALGYTSHHPRWAIAYKFESPQGVSVVRQIDVQIGRTGRITPVARIDAVEIGGSTVQNVTLHNQAYIEMLELSVGDTVTVSKRGDVIPAVERVIEKNEIGNSLWKMPKNCPVCATELIQKGAHLFCDSDNCPAKLRETLFFFAGKGGMDIESLGPETLNLLFDRKLICKPSDIYKYNYYDLADEKGFGEKKISAIYSGIAKSKEQPFSRLLSSLGIPELGKKAAELLTENEFTSVEELVLAAEKNDIDRFSSVDGIGPIMALHFVEAFSSTIITDELENFSRSGLKMYSEKKEMVSDVFNGQSWCITGSFENYKPRTLAAVEIESRGGRVVTGVTGKTTHLLAGEAAGSKKTKAEKLGVAIINEQDFIKMLEG